MDGSIRHVIAGVRHKRITPLEPLPRKTVDNNGETVVHAAAYKNLPKVVKFLTSKGARIALWN